MYAIRGWVGILGIPCFNDHLYRPRTSPCAPSRVHTFAIDLRTSVLSSLLIIYSDPLYEFATRSKELPAGPPHRRRRVSMNLLVSSRHTSGLIRGPSLTLSPFCFSETYIGFDDYYSSSAPRSAQDNSSVTQGAVGHCVRCSPGVGIARKRTGLRFFRVIHAPDTQTFRVSQTQSLMPLERETPDKPPCI